VDRWRHHNNKSARVGSSPFDFGEDHIINPFEAAAKLSDEKTKEDIRLGIGINKCPSYHELERIDTVSKWSRHNELASTKSAATTSTEARKHLDHNKKSLQKRQLEERARIAASNSNSGSVSMTLVVVGANDESKTVVVGGPNDHISQGGSLGIRP
jgi:hypothetical protein